AGTPANVDAAAAIQPATPGVRRIAAHFERAAMNGRQRVPHHAVRVLRTPRDEGQHTKSSKEQHAQNSRRPPPEAIHAVLLQRINLDAHQKNEPSRSCPGAQPALLSWIEANIEFMTPK